MFEIINQLIGVKKILETHGVFTIPCCCLKVREDREFPEGAGSQREPNFGATCQGERATAAIHLVIVWTFRSTESTGDLDGVQKAGCVCVCFFTWLNKEFTFVWFYPLVLDKAI